MTHSLKVVMLCVALVLHVITVNLYDLVLIHHFSYL